MKRVDLSHVFSRLTKQISFSSPPPPPPFHPPAFPRLHRHPSRRHYRASSYTAQSVGSHRTPLPRMSVFSAVNNFHAPEPYSRGEVMTPTTPRPNTAPHMQQMPNIDDATTPTRATFSNMASQKPLPSTGTFPSAMPVTAKKEPEKGTLQRNDSIVSAQSKRSHDVDMDDSDDGDDGSDDGSTNPDGSKSTKKKKGQKFWCTDFPPCNLSFTRSEHLARHIR